MRLKIEEDRPPVRSVTVITPTIGSEHLTKNMFSVQKATATYNMLGGGEVKHFVVADGKDCIDDVADQITDVFGMEINLYPALSVLNENVGANGWYGHRVYAAFSYLVNTDAVIFLDEDNWIEDKHIADLVAEMNSNNHDWCFSLRKIYDKNGEYLLHDNCESLGVHPTYVSDQIYHVDTSSYLVRKDVAVRVAPAWFGQWGQDRQYYAALKQFFPKFGTTGKHSLCYRLDGNPGSVSKEFFERGNKVMQDKYGDKLPWLKT